MSESASWIQMVKEVGFPIALVGYFIYCDWKRQARANTKEDNTALIFKDLNDKQYEIQKMAIQAVTAGNELTRQQIELQKEQVETQRSLVVAVDALASEVRWMKEHSKNPHA